MNSAKPLLGFLLAGKCQPSKQPCPNLINFELRETGADDIHGMPRWFASKWGSSRYAATIELYLRAYPTGSSAAGTGPVPAIAFSLHGCLIGAKKSLIW